MYRNLLQKAKEISEFAYCPYSNFKVGACILYENDKEYTGCNVENASYGLSLCAERNAISNAIAQGEKFKIKAIAVYSPNQKRCMPCGACRQWISEFALGDSETKVILEDENDEMLVLSLDEIFPYGFKFE